MLKDKSILITGGTGSFGKAFVRTVLERHPDVRRLVIYSRDELKQFEMSQTFSTKQHPGIRYFIGDIRDRDRLYRALQKVDIVVHAAALKQVDTAEYNPFEAVRTNVLGSQNVIDAAIDCGVRKVLALSTDKAANPINLYGATKLAADKLFTAANNYAGADSTRFAVVRYGNVLGSRGSVVPLFREQIRSGGPVTVTHEQIERYFMTIPEATQLILQGSVLGRGGEIFVLDMGSPVKIKFLAEQMIRLSGKVPYEEIGITITGLRPGEKLYEELLIGNNPTPSAHPRIMKAHEEFLPWEELQVQLEQLREAIEMERIDVLKDVLRTCVNGYVDSAYSPLK